MNSVNLCLCPSKKAVSCLQSRHVSFRLFGKTEMPLWTSPILTASPSLNPFVSSPTIPSKVASVAAFVPDFVGHSLLYLQAGRRGRMGPQYSGSSTPSSNSKSAVEYPSWHCYCGFTTHAKPASTWKNFSRMFYGCPNYKVCLPIRFILKLNFESVILKISHFRSPNLVYFC